MFVTDDGLFGLGFATPKVKDQVRILAGASVLFILQKKENGLY
jgi:hypothetical protein